jgi:RNA polymerase sigma-70 factor (ECF subfamily)
VTPSAAQDVSGLLRAWSCGDKAALDKLMPLVYDELRRLAHQYMRRERAGHTLQTTALVNEAYVRLVGANQVDWRDRAHFFAVSSSLMRRILIEFARARGRLKREGNAKRVSINGDRIASPQPPADLEIIDDVLNTLADFDTRKAKVVEMRFFGGLGTEEIAEVLKVSPDTVKRDWRLARVWLMKELRNRGRDEV